MGRYSSILGVILLLLVPADAAALWLDGQCSTELERDMWSDIAETVEAELEQAEQDAEDCEVDSADPSSNVCFEAAEHPISTLPELIAETQAERLGADVVDDVVEAMVAGVAPAAPAIPSADEASVEDPVIPGTPLAERLPLPRPPTPSSCTTGTSPDQCHSAPTIPTLNLEVSASPANMPSLRDPIPPALDELQRRGPPNPGLANASGVRSRVERPPEIT